MGISPSKEQNKKGKTVLTVKSESTRTEYKDGVKCNEEKHVHTAELSSDDSSHFQDIPSKMNFNQKALGYK